MPFFGHVCSFISTAHAMVFPGQPSLASEFYGHESIANGLSPGGLFLLGKLH